MTSVFGIDWLNKAKKHPQFWGWILNSQEYSNDFFQNTNNVSVASAINAITTPEPQQQQVSNDTTDVQTSEVLGVSEPKVEKVEVGDTPTEIQVAQMHQM